MREEEETEVCGVTVKEGDRREKERVCVFLKGKKAS